MRHVFVDESSQTAHRYMALGALVLSAGFVHDAEADLCELLSQHKITSGELKWTKVSRGKLDAYQAAVDYYFDRLAAAGAECHVLVVDTSQVDHALYNQGDEELGFNKFLFTLLYHRVGKTFGAIERIAVDLDARNTNRDIVELQLSLNRRVAKDLGIKMHYPFSRLAHRDSKSSRLMQVADLMSGAVAWHRNEHDKVEGASPAKTFLANHIARRVGLGGLGVVSSHFRETRLSVWNMALRPKRSRPAV